MVRACAYPNCKNRMSRKTPYSFHRLPLSNGEMLRLWLIVLQMDAYTPVQTLRLADLRVCSAHFSKEDYCQPKRRRNPIPKHLFLKKTAYPRVDRASDPVEPKDDVDGPGRISSTGTQVPETCTEAIKKLSLHHIVEEDAILQLMRNCPMCNRMCRCSKRSNGAYLIIYQNCYFCQFSRKWANQPGAADINIQKAKKQVKKKRQPKPKKKEPEKAEAEPVKQEEEEFAVTELLVPV